MWKIRVNKAVTTVQIMSKVIFIPNRFNQFKDKYNFTEIEKIVSSKVKMPVKFQLH